MSKYVPPHLRRIQEEEEKKRFVVPLTEEAKNAPPPSKFNFRAALTKNNKEFNVPRKTLPKTGYDYMCTQCEKMVKREDLNNNGTNYCWQCHNNKIFGNSNEGLECYNSDSDDDMMSFKDKVKQRYRDYLIDINE